MDYGETQGDGEREGGMRVGGDAGTRVEAVSGVAEAHSLPTASSSHPHPRPGVL